MLKAETGQQSPRQCPDGNRHSDDGKPRDKDINRRQKEMEKLIRKAAEIYTGLENVEQVSINFSTPYNHEGYTHDNMVIFFKDYENGEPRESRMYLFSIERQRWELYR